MEFNIYNRYHMYTRNWSLLNCESNSVFLICTAEYIYIEENIEITLKINCRALPIILT